jgi:DNA-directed RNA polymerase specialized sigma24 family protein
MEHDILAFGQDLIAARPKLCRAAQNLAGRDAGRLVTRIMDDAWRARDQFQPDQDLDAWLQNLLRRAVGEPRSFAED